MTQFEDKVNFIRKHVDEIAPITGETDALKLIETHTGIADLVIAPGKVETMLEQFETRIYVLEKEGCNPDAKRVVLEAAEPLAFLTIEPIIKHLANDPRCRAICLLTDNVAAKRFENSLDHRFQRLHDHIDPLVSDISGPFDIAIVAPEPLNSPNSPLLFGAKSVWGAKKLFFISGGWSGTPFTDFVNHDSYRRMDKIDGIFCNDEFAKQIFLRAAPWLSKVPIFLTGTPIFDALEIDKSAEHRRSGREKLNVADTTFCMLYLGDISSEYVRSGFEADERINEKTFEATLDAIIRFALKHKERNFALFLRPHPRDPNKEELFSSVVKRYIPLNLTVINASPSEISIQEAAYASDVITSIVSTENFLAPFRGKKAVFLGYKERGLGLGILRSVYGKKVIDSINHGENTRMVESPEDLIAYLETCMCDLTNDVPPVKSWSGNANAVENILDKILQ